MASCRSAIDAVDDVLIQLLEQRAAVVEVVQRGKTAAGLPRRDRRREREIVARLHALAPRLGEQRVQRLVEVIINECVDAAREAAEREGREWTRFSAEKLALQYADGDAIYEQD